MRDTITSTLGDFESAPRLQPASSQLWRGGPRMPRRSPARGKIGLLPRIDLKERYRIRPVQRCSFMPMACSPTGGHPTRRP